MDAGGLSTVRVTGTVFAIDLVDKVAMVEEGEVEVRSSAGNLRVLAGNEAGLNDGQPARASNLKSRLTWLAGADENGTVLSRAPGSAGFQPAPGSAGFQPANEGGQDGRVFSRAHPALDWSVEVNHLQLRGLTLAEAVKKVAEANGRPPALLALGAEEEGITGTPR